MKEYGQDLKKTHKQATTKLINVEAKIEKRFRLILESYSKYISDIEKNYIKQVGVSDLTIEKKLDIVINAERRYTDDTSSQLEMFGNE